jgi:uncharacterized protein YjbJ (UPF0337 family)
MPQEPSPLAPHPCPWPPPPQAESKQKAKEFEGKTQESIGNVTGNQGDRLAGKKKQVEAKIQNTVEDIKETAGMG